MQGSWHRVDGRVDKAIIFLMFKINVLETGACIDSQKTSSIMTTPDGILINRVVKPNRHHPCSTCPKSMLQSVAVGTCVRNSALKRVGRYPWKMQQAEMGRRAARRCRNHCDQRAFYVAKLAAKVLWLSSLEVPSHLLLWIFRIWKKTWYWTVFLHGSSWRWCV